MRGWLHDRGANISAARLSIRHRVSQGFTVIELMIVGAIVAVLAFLASAWYANYTDRTRVYQAVVDIGGLQISINQYYLNNSALPDDLGQTGQPNKLDPWGRPYVYVNLRRRTATAPLEKTTS